jgi:hypothetical protein
MVSQSARFTLFAESASRDITFQWMSGPDREESAGFGHQARKNFKNNFKASALDESISLLIALSDVYLSLKLPNHTHHVLPDQKTGSYPLAPHCGQ